MTGRMLPPSNGPRPVGENLYRPNRWATLGNLAGYSLFLIATSIIATLIATR